MILNLYTMNRQGIHHGDIMEIRKLQKLKDHPDLHKGQKVKLRVNYYGTSSLEDEWRIVHRKGDIGVIDGFGIISGQEVVAVEICHHEEGIFVVVPTLPSDLTVVPDDSPVTQPVPGNMASVDPLQALEEERPVILFDILGLPGADPEQNRN